MVAVIVALCTVLAVTSPRTGIIPRACLSLPFAPVDATAELALFFFALTSAFSAKLSFTPVTELATAAIFASIRDDVFGT